MRFRRVAVRNANGLAEFYDGFDGNKFKKLVNDYDVSMWEPGDFTHFSWSGGLYLRRLLTEGSRAHERWKTEGEQYRLNWKYSSFLFDHGATWKRKDGAIFLTGMPYLNEELSIKAFNELKEEFSFPETVKLAIMDDCYKYRINGDMMIAVYDDRFWGNYFKKI